MNEPNIRDRRHKNDRCQYVGDMVHTDVRIYRNKLLLEFLEGIEIDYIEDRYAKRQEDCVNIAYEMIRKLKSKCDGIDVKEAPKWIMMFSCFSPSIIYREYVKVSIQYQNGMLVLYDTFDDGEIIYTLDLIECPRSAWDTQRKIIKEKIDDAEFTIMYKIEMMVNPSLKFESSINDIVRFSNMPKLFYEKKAVMKVAGLLGKMGHIVRVV